MDRLFSVRPLDEMLHPVGVIAAAPTQSLASVQVPVIVGLASFPEGLCSYSFLKVIIGSTWVARCAGKEQAANAAVRTMGSTTASVRGS